MAAFSPTCQEHIFQISTWELWGKPWHCWEESESPGKKRERERKGGLFFSQLVIDLQYKQRKINIQILQRIRKFPGLVWYQSLVFPQTHCSVQAGSRSSAWKSMALPPSPPSRSLSSLCFPVDGQEMDGQYMNRIPYPASHNHSWFVRDVCFWGCTSNSVRRLLSPVRRRGAQEGQLIIVSKWAKRSYQDLPPGLDTAPYEDLTKDWKWEKGKKESFSDKKLEIYYHRLLFEPWLGQLPVMSWGKYSYLLEPQLRSP